MWLQYISLCDTGLSVLQLPLASLKFGHSGLLSEQPEKQEQEDQGGISSWGQTSVAERAGAAVDRRISVQVQQLWFLPTKLLQATATHQCMAFL